MRYTVSKFPWKDWYSPLLNTSAHSIPTLRAAAVVSRAWLLWADLQVTNVSAARACACAISYSSLRGLSPPRMRSVRSSRLMKTLGPSLLLKCGKDSKGVGRRVKGTRGYCSNASSMDLTIISSFLRRELLPTQSVQILFISQYTSQQ